MTHVPSQPTHFDRLHHGHRAAVPGEAQRARRFNVRQLWHFAAEYLLLLPLGAAIALVWANTAAESYFRMVFAIDFFVNDIAMVLFFGWMMKEVVEATAPGGVLHSWRRVAFPVVASVGMTLLPAIVHAVAATAFDEPQFRRGWPVAFATDLAFGYFVARIIFGRHPVVPFFLLLAISANGLGFLALAGVAHQLQLAIAGPLLIAAIGVAMLLRRARVKQFWPYILGGGGLAWAGLYFGGLHPALALVPIVPFLPHAKRDPGFFVDASPLAHDALSRFELWCRHPAQVALFLFGLVTAGVQIGAVDDGAWSLPLAALAGKPAGLLLGAAFAIAAGLHLPRLVGWRHLVVVGFICSIGFTVALYFAVATFGPGPLLSGLKFGALITLAGGLLAPAFAWMLRVGRFAPR
jgi:NhaA family Na+:H+ antiporter